MLEKKFIFPTLINTTTSLLLLF